MERFEFLTRASPWYLFLCLLAGAGYAALLYYRTAHPWGNRTNVLLAALRGALAAALCFLLLEPFVRLIRTLVEKPTVVVAVDNSASVRLTTDSARLATALANLRQTVAALEEEGLAVEVQTLDTAGASLDSLRFDVTATDLQALLGQVQRRYENRNLGGVVLLSDGIYNQGLSPAYRPLGFPVVAVGAGDTTRRQDVGLRTLYFNQVAYQGNRFPVVAEVQHNGLAGQAARVRLRQGGQTLATETVTLAPGGLQQVTFYTTAERNGTQHYVVTVDSLPGEFTTQNNARDAYVEVIDSREKILIAAAAPHPDVKALRAVLSAQQDYEVAVHVPGVNALPDGPFDLIILHQIPDRANRTNALLEELLRGKTPLWFILGAQSNLSRFNAVNNVLRIAGRPGQTDEVTPAFDGAFSRFRFEGNHERLFPRLPPAVVPFGDYTLLGDAGAVLRQRVGTLVTNKPLLAFRNVNGRKVAVLAGEGLWRWRLQEYALNERHEVVDELVRKLVQLLSAQDDKRRFRFYPTVTDLYESDRVVFEAEVYNEIFEPVYGQTVDVRLTNERDETTDYSFETNSSSARLDVGTLPQGVYRYVATTTLDGRAARVAGEFTVRRRALESLSLTANHDLLRTLATSSGGAFFEASETGALADYLRENRPASTLRQQEENRPLVDLPWLLAVLLGLISLEWFVRKYQGGY